MSTDKQSVMPRRRLPDRLREGLDALLSRAGQQFDPQRRREIISELFSIWNEPQISIRRFAVLIAGPEEPLSAKPLAALLTEQLGEPLEFRVRWAPVIELAVDVGDE